MMYAELMGNYEKQRIKSLCDNKFAYVNFGHRTRGHKGWVPGQFFVEKSETQVQKVAPKMLEAKLKKFLEECMG